MSSDYQLEDTIYLPFTTRAFATGIPTALVSGVIDIYENVTATPIITAETLTVSLNGHAGFNVITVAATAASGFEVGGSYTAILDAGTVDSVSVIGEVVAHFTIDASAAAQDLANGTDGLSAIKAETALIVEDTNELQTDDVPGLIATAQADLDTITGSAGVIIDDSAANDTVLSDAIWDELKSGHVVANSFGDFLDIEVSSRSTFAAGQDVNVASMDANSIASGTIAAGELTNIEDEIWDALKSAHVVANSFGDFLDIEISSRMAEVSISTTGGAVDTVTDVTNDVGITQAGADKVWGTAARILTASTNFNDLSAAEVNAQVDLGLTDIRLDELLAADSDIDGASPPTVGSVFHELMTKTAGSFTYDQADDSLEAIRDQGDSAWLTATGFSTHSAANVWAVDATGEQTQGSFGQAIGDPGADADTLYGSVVTGAAGANISVDIIAIKAETAVIEGQTDDIGVAGAGLTDLGGMSDGMKAEVLVEVNAALDAAISELSQAQPTATPSIRTGIMLMYMTLRNQLDVQTSGTDAIEIHNAAGTMIARKLLTDAGGDYSEALMVAGS